MSPFFAAFSIFLIAVQASESGLHLDQQALKMDHEGLVSEVKDWLADTMKDFQTDVDGQVQNLKTVLESSHKEGEQKIHSMYDTSIRKLRQINAPEECLSHGEQKMLLNKQLTVNNFFRCSNLTEAAKDVVSITFAAGTLVSDLLLSADQLLNGFSECWSWNPLKFMGCAFSWVKNVVSGAFKTFRELKEFTTKIGDFLADIKAQIDFCKSEGQETVLEHMAVALNIIHDCTLKSMKK